MTTTKHIEFKSANSSGIAQVLANKGICWQVMDDEGEIFLVQKKHVVRGPWEESDDAAPAPAAGSVAAQILAAAAKAEPKARVKKEPAVTNPDLITLKQLCFDLDLEPRIARRKLRKALGNIGTGSRWEWTKGSAELIAVQKALAGAEPAPANILAEALDGLYDDDAAE